MEAKSIDEVITKSRISILDGRYAYVKMKDEEETEKDEFTGIPLPMETTYIVEEKLIKGYEHAAEEKWFKGLAFDQAQAFSVPDFLGKITACLANESIAILVVSSFANDIVFIREENLMQALVALEKIGFKIKTD